MNLLALDFDGVVWDSVGECYHTAVSTFKRLFAREPGVDEALFRQGRWLVRTGRDFYVVLRHSEENPAVDWQGFDKAEFSALKESWLQECLAYETSFYELRQRQRDGDFAAWSAHQQPYPEFLEQLPELRQLFGEIVVATTKDETSAKKLLASVDLDFAVVGREFSVDKAEQIHHLCQSRNLAPASVVFVDDLIDNLERVQSTGATVALADWGYNTPHERRQADEAGIARLQLDGLAKQLKGLIPVLPPCL